MNMQYYLNIEHQVLNDTPPVDACVACRSLLGCARGTILES